MINLNELNLEELKAVATESGMAFGGNTGLETLKNKLTSFLEEKKSSGSPITGEDNTEPVKKEGEDNPTPKKEGEVTIESIHRGVIATRFGKVDFGDTGVVKVTPEIADYLCALNGYKKC